MDTERYLSAYYFMGQTLCSVREDAIRDMEWLAGAGFDAVCICVHEFQLLGVHTHGLRLLCNAAHEAGLEVLAVPSRWCGLIAGWPPSPGQFAATRPDTWMLGPDGKPEVRPYCGALCSVHHVDVVTHMEECTLKMLQEYEFDGIVWDEVKTLWNEFRQEELVDYHPAAIENLGEPASGEEQRQASFEVLARCNRTARDYQDDLRIVGFVYANLADEIVEPWARTDGFDEVGPDGRPGFDEDYPTVAGKTLLSNADRFLSHAASAGRRSFALLETQFFDGNEARVAVDRAEQICEAGFDHLSVYYHPMVEEAEGEVTETLARILGEWRRG